MNKSRLLSFLKVAGVIALVSLSRGEILYADSNITICGSTTVLPVATRAAEEFMDMHEDVSISIRGGGSGVGIAALIDGRIDIADASRPIKTKELKVARERGINPVANVIANDGIAVVVHPNNTVTELDITAVKAIYTGEIANWKELGGPSMPIVVVSRDVASGTFEVFKKLVLRGAKVKDGALMLASNKAVATTVAQTPGAIGYIGLGFLSEDVKALKIEGVTPSPETVKSEEYKLARPLFMYTNGKPKGLVKNFINFILSPQGQAIVKEVGYVPVR